MEGVAAPQGSVVPGKYGDHSSLVARFSNLYSLLESLPHDLTSSTIEQNSALIARLGRPENALTIVEQVLEDETLLAGIASRSYRHINHFDKVVLVGSDRPSAYRLTLHLWRPPYRADEMRDELIHDHRFNFWSVILAGALVSENFQLGETGDVFKRYHYVPESRGRTFRDFYEYRGEVRLKRSATKVRQAGESYFLAAPSVHRIVLPQSELTCSLVLRGPRLREYSAVFNTTYPNANIQFDNVMFASRELRERLTVLAAALRKRCRGEAA